MNEDISRAVLRSDETETLLGVEPFHASDVSLRKGAHSEGAGKDLSGRLEESPGQHYEFGVEYGVICVDVGVSAEVVLFGGWKRRWQAGRRNLLLEKNAFLAGNPEKLFFSIFWFRENILGRRWLFLPNLDAKMFSSPSKCDTQLCNRR